MGLLIAVLVIAGVAFWFLKARVGDRSDVAGRIPQIVAEFERQGGVGTSFVAFVITPPNDPSGGSVDLQYSIERGRLGLDWVLKNPRNVTDQARFVEVVTRLGYAVMPLEMNGVQYLRVEGKGLAELGLTVMREVYGVSEETKVGVIKEYQ